MGDAQQLTDLGAMGRDIVGGIVGSDFRVVRPLDAGGMGAVYVAEQMSTGALVALKVMARPDDPQARNSLKRELAALLAVHHDRIPKLYDWNIDGETCFAAIQYFPAGSLADAWPFLGRLSAEQTWRLLSDLMQALGAAHAIARIIEWQGEPVGYAHAVDAITDVAGHARVIPEKWYFQAAWHPAVTMATSNREHRDAELHPWTYNKAAVHSGFDT